MTSKEKSVETGEAPPMTSSNAETELGKALPGEEVVELPGEWAHRYHLFMGCVDFASSFSAQVSAGI